MEYKHSYAAKESVYVINIDIDPPIDTYSIRRTNPRLSGRGTADCAAGLRQQLFLERSGEGEAHVEGHLRRCSQVIAAHDQTHAVLV